MFKLFLVLPFLTLASELVVSTASNADVKEANFYRDYGFIDSTCMAHRFNQINVTYAERVLRSVYKRHKNSPKKIEYAFEVILGKTPSCRSIVPLEVLKTINAKRTSVRNVKSQNRICKFNNGSWIDVDSVDRGSTFSLNWNDGKKMTYQWVGSNADRHNITDTLGGKWRYSDHRTKGGMTLTNLSNGNKIVCLKGPP